MSTPPFLINKPSLSNMTGIGKQSDIPARLSRYATLNAFKSAVKGLKNHFFAAICGFVQLQKLTFTAVIASFIGTLYTEVDLF